MKVEKHCVKIKLRRNPKLEKLDMQEFKSPLEFLSFVRNFKMKLDASGTITVNAKLRYLRTILGIEALGQFDSLCAQVGITNMSHFKPGHFRFRYVLLPVNEFSKQKREMCHGTKNPRKLKVIH